MKLCPKLPIAFFLFYLNYIKSQQIDRPAVFDNFVSPGQKKS